MIIVGTWLVACDIGSGNGGGSGSSSSSNSQNSQSGASPLSAASTAYLTAGGISVNNGNGQHAPRRQSTSSTGL